MYVKYPPADGNRRASMLRLIASIRAIKRTMANANGAMSPANDPTMKPNENSVAIAGATSVTDCISTSGRRRAPAWRSVFATSTSSEATSDMRIPPPGLERRLRTPKVSL